MNFSKFQIATLALIRRVFKAFFTQANLHNFKPYTMKLFLQVVLVLATLFSAHLVLMSPIAQGPAKFSSTGTEKGILTDDFRNLSNPIRAVPSASSKRRFVENVRRANQEAFKLLNSDWKEKIISTEWLSCGEANMMMESGTDSVTLPPDVCGLCPKSGHEGGLYPCTCVNNGGNLGGTISIDCPPEVSSQEILRDIIQRTHFLTTNVSRFSLNASNITGVLDLTMLGPLTVRVLIFDNDQFQNVDNHAFNSSEQTLNTISLAHNLITYFHFDSVATMPLLKSLDLSGNFLDFIPSQAFMNPNLQIVDISGNNIYTLSFEAFLGLASVEIIDLSENNLSELQQNTFKITNHDVNKVLEIDISNNYIRYITPDAFADLNNLQVNLSNNELQTVDSAVFRPPIENSGYFAQFILDGNPINCDCGIYWIISDSIITNCFDNFHCHDINATLYELEPDDFTSCFNSNGKERNDSVLENGLSSLVDSSGDRSSFRDNRRESSTQTKIEHSSVINLSQEEIISRKGNNALSSKLDNHLITPW